MIRSKEDYIHYLEQDRLALGIPDAVKKPRFGKDDIWRWECLLRKCEYNLNCRKGSFSKIIGALLRYRFRKESIRLGFTIPFNTFEEGLCIWHYGTITVNSRARVGKNCRLSEGTNIGDSKGMVPVIGDNVFICTGAKVFGDVRIADNVVIGANSVVTKSVDESGVTVAGNPARKISDRPSRTYLDNRLFGD